MATENGEVPIQGYSSLYYVRVDLDYKPVPIPDPDPPYIPKMLISLSNSETLLTTKCRSFDKYNCSAHNCNVTENNMTFNYRYLAVTAQIANADLFLDYSSWILKNNVYLGGDCYGKSIDFFQKDRVGVIGLGTAGHASDSFISSKVFSIYLSTDEKFGGGKLLFRYDKSLTASDEKIVLHTDANWRTSIVPANASLKIGDDILYLPTGSLIFDIHFDKIGLPLKTYERIQATFREQYRIICSSMSDYYYHCDYKGYISDLPTIYLKIGENSIKIPPELYVRSPSTSQVYSIDLKIAALDPDLNYDNWVTDDYKNTVVLGSCFMKYYYSVFDLNQGKNTISLYVAGSRSSYLLPIILAVIAFIIICGVCFFVYKKKKRQAILVQTTALLVVVQETG